MKQRTITARVSASVNNEIEFIKSSLNLPNITSVLTYAVHTLYEAVKEEGSKKTSLEMFMEKGLLGCLEGKADLSTTYKNELSAHIATKHSQPPKKGRR